jgi:hypothetical protein
MTKNSKIAAATVSSLLVLAGGAATAYRVSGDSTTATTTTSPLAAPLLNIVSVGETEIHVDWGPSQPGPFTISNVTARSAKISWPPAIDTLHPVGLTYTAKKGSSVSWRDISRTYVTVGFATTVRSFRFCVKAKNSAGKESPYKCTTFTGQ